MLAQDALQELFDYDPSTGLLTWKVNRGSNKTKSLEAGTLLPVKGDKTYRHVSINGKKYLVHRVIWVWMTGEEPNYVDHINGDGLDNSWPNLREVNSQTNNRNKRKYSSNTSGVCGVYWEKARNKWRASIRIGGKDKHLGLFEVFEDAVARRKAVEIEHGFHKNHGKLHELHIERKNG